jgi:hypothetical protein
MNGEVPGVDKAFYAWPIEEDKGFFGRRARTRRRGEYGTVNLFL